MTKIKQKRELPTPAYRGALSETSTSYPVPQEVREEGRRYARYCRERLDDALHRYDEKEWGLNRETKKLWKKVIFSLYEDCLEAEITTERLRDIGKKYNFDFTGSRRTKHEIPKAKAA